MAKTMFLSGIINTIIIYLGLSLAKEYNWDNGSIKGLGLQNS